MLNAASLRPALALVLAQGFAVCAVARAQTPTLPESQKLLDATSSSGDHFGTVLAVDGDLCLVGSPDDNYLTGDSGSAVLYRWSGNTWQHGVKLTADYVWMGMQFGSAVAVHDEVLAIGAREDIIDQTQKGSATIEHWTGFVWASEQKLVADDGAPQDSFGAAVALGTDVVAVGAPQNQGGVYVFRKTAGQWSLEQKLTDVFSGSANDFGYALAMDGDRLVVGVPGADNPPDYGAGAVGVYHWDGSNWALEQVLTAPDVGPVHGFGVAVAARDGRIVVGAPAPPYSDYPDPGSAFVFRWDGSAYALEQGLFPSDGATYDRFGQSVGISGGSIVVGAPHHDTGGNADRGAAYAYRWSGSAWFEEHQLVDAAGATDDRLGTAVAVDGGRSVAGASWDDAPTQDCGSAGAFDVSVGPWTYLGHALAGSAGFPFLAAYGSLASSSPVTMRVGGTPPYAHIALVIGFSELDVPFKGGVLVPSPDAMFPGLVADSHGDYSLTTTWPAGVPAGIATFYQAWIADASAPKGLAASNGVTGTTP